MIVTLPDTQSAQISRGKTIKYLGHGFLGQYDRHVKDRINALLGLIRHTCVTDPLEPLLIATALLYGRDHKGMPR